MISGPFSTKSLEEAGFICPKMKFPLRNPVRIAEHAHFVTKDGAKNLLDGVLRSPIEIPGSGSASNVVDGQLIQIEEEFKSCLDALCAVITKLPSQKSACFFIDDREMSEDPFETIDEAFSKRPVPTIFTGSEKTFHLKNWLCQPKRRVADMCIIGKNHQCNGIETEIVVHVYPSDCPCCSISHADPVIISRATAMLVSGISYYLSVLVLHDNWL